MSLPVCLVRFMASLRLRCGPSSLLLPHPRQSTVMHPRCAANSCKAWKGLTEHVTAQMLVAGWKALGMVERCDFVGIMGFASMDWLVSDIATTHMGGVMSPLPTNILVEDIKHLILEAEVGMHSPQPCLHSIDLRP